MISRRSGLVVVTAILASAMSLTVPAVRVPVLQAAGEALMAEQHPLEPADIIVVAVDAGSAGVLEAADLVESGVATRAAVFASARAGITESQKLLWDLVRHPVA